VLLVEEATDTDPAVTSGDPADPPKGFLGATVDMGGNAADVEEDVIEGLDDDDAVSLD